MVNKQCRLLHKRQFDEVFRSNKKFHCVSYVLFVKKNGLEHARIGFALAKKRVSKATNRNRIKRVFREIFRINVTQLPAVDIVVIAKSPIATTDNQHLFRQIEQTWQKINEFYSA